MMRRIERTAHRKKAPQSSSFTLQLPMKSTQKTQKMRTAKFSWMAVPV